MNERLGGLKDARRPLIERTIVFAAKGMIAMSVVLGGLAGLALLGFYSSGPIGWVSQSASPLERLIVVFVVWPACGLTYLGMEVLAGYLHEKWGARRQRKQQTKPATTAGRT